MAAFNAAAQADDPDSLLAFYKAMLALRNTQAAIRSGSCDAVAVAGSVMSFQRRLGAERVVVVINYASAAANVALGSLPANGLLASAYPAGGADLVIDASGAASVTVAAQTVRVLTLK